MTPKPAREELATSAEIARMLDVPIKRVVTWIERSKRNGFPTPVAKLDKPGRGKGFLWRKNEVIHWHQGYNSTYWRMQVPPVAETFTMLGETDEQVRRNAQIEW